MTTFDQKVLNLQKKSLVYGIQKLSAGHQYFGQRLKKRNHKIIFSFVDDNGYIKCHSCRRVGTHVIVHCPHGERNLLTGSLRGTAHLDIFCELSKSFILMTIDHILPKSLGGSNQKTNLRPMCMSCNVSRGNKLNEEDLELIMSNPSNHLHILDRKKRLFTKYLRNRYNIVNGY